MIKYLVFPSTDFYKLCTGNNFIFYQTEYLANMSTEAVNSKEAVKW